MARGLFVISIQPNGDGKLLAKYIASDYEDISLGPDDFLNIQMNFSPSDKINITSYPNYVFMSFNNEYRVKRDVYHLVSGVILEKDEDTLLFRDALSMYASDVFEKKDGSNTELIALSETAFEKDFKNPAVMFDIDKVKNKMRSQLKELTKNGKLNEASILSQQLKTIPDKILENTKKAEKFLIRGEYDKAGKVFLDAKTLSQEINEPELIKLFSDKIKLMERIPSLLEDRTKVVNDAVLNLKNGNWEKSSRAFSKAADISKELSDAQSTEEYDAKAKTLAEYVKIEKRFKKR